MNVSLCTLLHKSQGLIIQRVQSTQSSYSRGPFRPRLHLSSTLSYPVLWRAVIVFPPSWVEAYANCTVFRRAKEQWGKQPASLSLHTFLIGASLVFVLLPTTLLDFRRICVQQFPEFPMRCRWSLFQCPRFVKYPALCEVATCTGAYRQFLYAEQSSCLSAISNSCPSCNGGCLTKVPDVRRGPP